MDSTRRTFLAGSTAAVAAASAGPKKRPTPSKSKVHGLPDPSRLDLSDPTALSLTECAAALQARRLSSRELTQACLDRIGTHDGAITAMVRVYPEVALDLAAKADERLSARSVKARGRRAPLLTGVPLALKDLYAVAGLPLTASSKVLEGNVAAGDCTVWRKLRHHGMVLLGHAHTDEFAFGVGTPQSGNPWDPARSPGGSSGGSGAALGARFVPAATGTDTGGSLRLPATACGVTALKPSFGLVSTYGVIPLVWSRDHAGPMGRSAADCSLLLGGMAGPDPDDPPSLSAAAVPSAGFPLTPRKGPKPLGGLRVGTIKGGADGLPAATATLYAQFLDELRTLGATVVEVAMPTLPEAPLGLSEIAQVGVYHEQFGPTAIPKYRAEIGAIAQAAVAAGTTPVRDGLIELRDRTRFQHEFNALFARQDLTAIALPGSNVDGASRVDLAGLTVLSGSVPGDVVWANLTGAPAICTPAGRSAATGMPFGVQLGAPPGQDAAVLQLAIDHQHAFPHWREAPRLEPAARDVPTARPVTPPAHPDPTSTDATHPALHLVATTSTTPV